MILPLIGWFLGPQSSSFDPVAQVRAIVAPVTVEAKRDGEFLRIALKHPEPNSEVGGGQGGNGPPPGVSVPPPTVIVTEELLLTSIDASRPSEAAFTSENPLANYFLTSAYLGQGDGYRWYVRAGFKRIASLAKGLSLSGGEDLTQIAVRALNFRDWRNQAEIESYLASVGDAAVGPLTQAAPKKPEAIAMLARIRSEQAVAALLDLHRNPDLSVSIQESLAWGKPVASARPIYEASLEDGHGAVFAASAAAMFGWRDLAPQVERQYTAARDPYSATSLLNSLATMHSGKSLPAYEKVSNGFADWTANDDAAVLAAKEPDYPILVALRMTATLNKRGRPHLDRARALLAAQRKAGHGERIEHWVAQLNIERNLIGP